MQDNPFSDTIPTPLALSASVQSKAEAELAALTKSGKPRLVFLVGSYGNGKSHALLRLKNEINIKQKRKLACYVSAFSTKTLKRVYEQVCTDLVNGKYSKLLGEERLKTLLEKREVSPKIINLFFKGKKLRDIERLSEDLPFGKTVSSSSDIIHFLCTISILSGQLILIIDDFEEAASLDRTSRKAFLGYFRALYDHAVRLESGLVLILSLTPEKYKLIEFDRPDFVSRASKTIFVDKLPLADASEIVKKRLEVSGLKGISVRYDAIKQAYDAAPSMRAMLNLLRNSLDQAVAKDQKIIESVNVPEQLRFAPIQLDEKPADSVILSVLQGSSGLSAKEIIQASGKSASWIQHRLAELVASGVLKKEQAARNRQAKYSLNKPQ